MMSDGQTLNSKERVLWNGAPHPAQFAFRKGWMTFVFGIPFLAFAIFWMTMASKADVQFSLHGIPFVIVGCCLVGSPLWHAFRGARTMYALTNQRAVIDTTGPFARRITVPLQQIQFIELRGGSGVPYGDVLFRETPASSYQALSGTKDGFIAITDAPQVEQLMREAIGKASNSSVASAA